MIQNLVWATGYNLIAIPVAAGLFVHWGFDLPMSVRAVAMSLSTIIVAANAQLLRGLKLQQGTLPHDHSPTFGRTALPPPSNLPTSPVGEVAPNRSIAA